MDLKILVVDDDQKIVELVEIYLVNEGYKVLKAYNGIQALEIIQKETIHLLILDVMMPEMDGMEVCRRIRAKQTTPILMLSAKSEDMDKILGLMTGADDYMVKPFNPLELLARVKSLLRRASYTSQVKKVQQEGFIQLDNSLELNKFSHTVQFEGRPIKLTAIEFEILYLLTSNLGRVFSSEEIFERVWGERAFEATNTVMVHISNLREKLEKEMNGEKMIQTVWGVGYKIER